MKNLTTTQNQNSSQSASIWAGYPRFLVVMNKALALPTFLLVLPPVLIFVVLNTGVYIVGVFALAALVNVVTIPIVLASTGTHRRLPGILALCFSLLFLAVVSLFIFAAVHA